MAEVSICIPAYNAEKYLPETLESIRNQTFKDWELIVTEDGSKDRTEDLVSEFAQSVSQPVRYQRHQKNKGLSPTRNSGIQAAASPLVALLDADDYWAPDHLESIVAVFEEREVDIVHSGSILFDDETREQISVRAPTPEEISNFRDSLYRHTYIIQPSSVVIRDRVFKKIGYFDTCFKICDDMEFWFRATRNGFNFAYTGKNSCFYRKHGTALSSRSAALVEETALVYEKHLDWPEIPRALRRETTSKTFADAGKMNFRSNPDKAGELYFRAWKHYPIAAKYLFFSAMAGLRSLVGLSQQS